MLVATPLACSGDDGNNNMGGIQCSDGRDNDGDGMVDFPADLGCTGEDDETEDSPPSAQCSDGRDNDGDGKTDFPNDPGCYVELQDGEEDNCPDGPGCPECADGIDNDENGKTDFPDDSGGCASASSSPEYTRNPTACGATVQIDQIPIVTDATGTLMAGAPSKLMSATCGGSGAEAVYEFRVTVPKVVVASTDNEGTTADTVVYIRGADCQNTASEVACNDDVSTSDKQSTVTEAISTPGTYYIVVDSKDALGGTYQLSVDFFVGEGTQCQLPDECGPGLVCRIPKGGTTKVCMKHVCEDGMDEDGDGKNDYPDDPGCTSLVDDDETDTCPGVGCPECGDGVDNDNDNLTDYGPGGDPTCSSASSASESCVSTDGVSLLTMASTTGTTVGANNDVKPSCASTLSTAMAPDLTYRLDLPPMDELRIDNVNTFSAATALYDSTCGGTALACDSISSPERITVPNLAAGTYYYVVDGYSTATGAFTINVSGRIKNGESCESDLAKAGAITCNLGYICQGATNARTCQPAVCSDGINNNDGDQLIDYPLDPGCSDPADTSEADPATPPVCSNGIDDDADNMIDYPADIGCAAASGPTEAFCTGETNPTAGITTTTVMGTTTGATDNWKPSCGTSSHTAVDVAYSLQLPVSVATLVIDTIGSAFDTTVALRTLDCATEIDCNDEGGGSNTSKLTLTGVAPGGYAIIVDGWSSGNGAYKLNVKGTVAAGTRCDSPLFSGGASAVLVCPATTTCNGSPIPRCQ